MLICTFEVYLLYDDSDTEAMKVARDGNFTFTYVNLSKRLNSEPRRNNIWFILYLFWWLSSLCKNCNNVWKMHGFRNHPPVISLGTITLHYIPRWETVLFLCENKLCVCMYVCMYVYLCEPVITITRKEYVKELYPQSSCPFSERGINTLMAMSDDFSLQILISQFDRTLKSGRPALYSGMLLGLPFLAIPPQAHIGKKKITSPHKNNSSNDRVCCPSSKLLNHRFSLSVFHFSLFCQGDVRHFLSEKRKWKTVRLPLSFFVRKFLQHAVGWLVGRREATRWWRHWAAGGGRSAFIIIIF